MPNKVGKKEEESGNIALGATLRSVKKEKRKIMGNKKKN
jgi:hypothetical protein